MIVLVHPDFKGMILYDKMNFNAGRGRFDFVFPGTGKYFEWFHSKKQAYNWLDKIIHGLQEERTLTLSKRNEMLKFMEELEPVEIPHFIDLGLPSGKKWATVNEDGYFTFDDARKAFGSSLPTQEDFRELVTNCRREWDGELFGMKFTGPNGAAVFLPALGIKARNSAVYCRGDRALYWSSSDLDEKNAYSLFFDNSDDNTCAVNDSDRFFGFNVRLVQA